MKHPALRKILAEMLGTYFLVFAGTGAIITNEISGGAVTHVGISLVFGLIVTGMIYALGDVSGAHINPAVTLAFWAAGRFPLRSVPGYLMAQFAGALLGSGTLKFLFSSHATLGATLPSQTWGQSFVLEVLLTMLLLFVVFNVATGSRETGLMAGVAIGGIVALEALFAGPICGASMNPARSLGPALVSGHTEHLWVYLLAPVVGGLLGYAAFCLIRDPASGAVAAKS